MSLEIALNENTQVMKQLIAMWAQLTNQAKDAAANPEGFVAAGKQVDAGKPKKDAKPVIAPLEEVAVYAPEPAPSAEPAPAATTGLSFQIVRDLVLKLAPANREAIKALNAKHGIVRLSDLLEVADDFNSAVKDVAKLAAIHADLQALGA